MLALLSNWRVVLVAVLLASVVGLGWALKHQIGENGALSESLTVANQTAKDNAEQVEVLQAAMLMREQAIANAQAKQAAAEKRAASIKEEITHAEDGPLAPALSVALERLRADEGNPQSGDGHGNGSSGPNRAN